MAHSTVWMPKAKSASWETVRNPIVDNYLLIQELLIPRQTIQSHRGPLTAIKNQSMKCVVHCYQFSTSRMENVRNSLLTPVQVCLAQRLSASTRASWTIQVAGSMSGSLTLTLLSSRRALSWTCATSLRIMVLRKYSSYSMLNTHRRSSTRVCSRSLMHANSGLSTSRLS